MVKAARRPFRSPKLIEINVYCMIEDTTAAETELESSQAVECMATKGSPSRGHLSYAVKFTN
jgi:hypothetical protein